MFRVLVDTNVWFNIIEEKRLVELAVLEQLIRRRQVSLIVPQLAIDEFKRNRARITDKTINDPATKFGFVKHAVEKVGIPGPRQKQVLDYLDYVAEHVPTEGGDARQALDRMERLLMAESIVETPTGLVLNVMQRALEGRAPFHKGRNAVADAILLETYAMCLRESTEADVRFAFVSHNSKEFSAVEGHHKNPHPDLRDIFDHQRSIYCISIQHLADFIDPGIVVELTARDDYNLAQLIDRYLEEAGDTLTTRVADHLRMLRRFPIATQKPAAKLQSNDYLQFLELRKTFPVKRAPKGVSPSTRLKDLDRIQVVLAKAQKEWSVGVSLEPLQRARSDALKTGLATGSGTRTHRLTAEQEVQLMAKLKERDAAAKAKNPLADIAEFTLWTGRRLSEVCDLKWDDFDKEQPTVVHTYAGKAQEAKTCVYTYKGKRATFLLVGRALEMVMARASTRSGPEIFPYNKKSISSTFNIVAKELGLKIVLDRLREVGIRKLLREYEPAIVSKIVAEKGNKVWNIYKEMQPEIAASKQMIVPTASVQPVGAQLETRH